ncbi:hypothetical protein PybrP1_010553 [[Pythium] brassicae (nom. inval.)]|nr:hypothetical protein PybrP1_010553 [[Pythium] brassicae (nom. inval.)]
MADECTQAAATESESATQMPPPPPTAREHEIEEVMQFLRYSVKESSTFDGMILFQFKDDAGEPAFSYAVEVAKDRRVTTHKNANTRDMRATCEVTISVDDFLWIYSGKASNTDIVKLFYAGRLLISGYAFRKVSAFAQSFDFSSDKWRSFYAWRDELEARARSPTALEEARNVGSPSRDFWFAHCRSVLDRYNVPKLQQLHWEASLANVFGEEYVLGSVCRALQKTPAPASSLHSAVANVLGASAAVAKQHDSASRLVASPDLHPHPHPHVDVHRELAHFFHPCTKQTAPFSFRKQPRADFFAFFDEAYVTAVKDTAKQRFVQQRRVKNRVDLADASMAQLDRLVQAIGRGGHCNRTNNTKSKHISAPELLLREFNGNANGVMDLLREKALGRQALDKIPPPNVDWLFGGRVAGNVLRVDDSRATAVAAADASSLQQHATGSAASASGSVATQSVVEVNRTGVQRRRSRRDFVVPKQRLKAKLASLSRDLAQQNSSVIGSVEEHWAFSDYL